jgi:hypothetical protein
MSDDSAWKCHDCAVVVMQVIMQGVMVSYAGVLEGDLCRRVDF